MADSEKDQKTAFLKAILPFQAEGNLKITEKSIPATLAGTPKQINGKIRFDYIEWKGEEWFIIALQISESKTRTKK